MKFSGIRMMSIDMLGLSQIYLNADKIASVSEWFDPHCMENFSPLPVHDFGNNVYTLTDGHTKASCAERNKLQKSVPDLFLYGASEDKSTLYFEDMAGRLFFFKDSILLPET